MAYTFFFLILNMQALLIWNDTSSLLKKQKCMFLDTAACWKKMMAHILNTKRSNKNCTDNILICQTSKLLHFSYECIVSRWCCITRWWGRACRAQKPYRFLNLCSETLWNFGPIRHQSGGWCYPYKTHRQLSIMLFQFLFTHEAASSPHFVNCRDTSSCM